jgi:uncharacterized membrane protein YphA (DoxX/SURF4 family)
MNTVLWIAQGLLALAFLGAGAMKLIQPKAKLQESSGMQWAEDFDQNIIRLIAVLEILGALGLVLPMLLNTLPVLTPLAGVGLGLIMIGAAFTHYRRGEMPQIGANAVLLALALFVAYGRFALVPVTA